MVMHDIEYIRDDVVRWVMSSCDVGQVHHVLLEFAALSHCNITGDEFLFEHYRESLLGRVRS